MIVPAHHLAQVNVGRLHAPEGSPIVADFFAALDPINALADAAPGFVWRLQTEDGNATDIRPYEDDLVIVNMSVWASLEELKAFVYRSDHRAVMARRREWFERMTDAYTALWWVPADVAPTVADAVERLETLRAKGPSPEAFTFRDVFPPPGA